MDDRIEVGVFAADGGTLYHQWHRVRSGAQTITVTVPGRPARAGVDPRHLLIDTVPADNEVAVQAVAVVPQSPVAAPTAARRWVDGQRDP